MSNDWGKAADVEYRQQGNEIEDDDENEGGEGDGALVNLGDLVRGAR